MKLKLLIIVFLVIVTIGVVAFLFTETEEKDFTKIETLIHTNSSELVKGDISSTKAEDKKLSLEIASKIHQGECPTHIDEKLKAYAIKNIASKLISENKADGVVNCIEKLGINKEQDYTLMVDLLPFWDKENPMVEKFYTTFFKGFMPKNDTVLGLLDNAKLMCVKAAIHYLTKDGYPQNVSQTMSKKEYSLFEEYIDEYRCAGYSS